MSAKRLHHIAVRFSEAEKAAIDLLAAQYQTTPSQAIRDAVLSAAKAALAGTEYGDRDDHR